MPHRDFTGGSFAALGRHRASRKSWVQAKPIGEAGFPCGFAVGGNAEPHPILTGRSSRNRTD